MKNFQFVKGSGSNLDQALAALEVGVKEQFGNDPCSIQNVFICPEAKPSLVNKQGYEVVMNVVAVVVFDNETPKRIEGRPVNW